MNASRPWLRALAAGLALLTCLQIIAILWQISAGCAMTETGLELASSPAFMLVGLLIIYYRPGNVIGWLMLLCGLAMSGLSFQRGYVECALSGGYDLPAVSYVAWFNHRFGFWLLLVPLFVLVPFLFPNGHFLGPRWRALCLGGLLLLAPFTLLTAFAPDLRMSNGVGTSFPLDSPLQWHGLSAAIYARLFGVQTLVAILLSVLGITSFALRFRRSRGVERQQMKWFATFLVTAVAVQLLVFELPANLLGEERFLSTSPFVLAYQVILYIVFLGFPLVIGIAVLRYRLYDIDVIIRRTLIYGLLTALLLAVYFGLVLLTQSAFVGLTGQESPLAIVISTLVIAALFNPLRRRIQAFIDRRFYRAQYDHRQVLAQFAQRARDEVEMERLAGLLIDTVDGTMQPETAELWLWTGDER